MNNLSVSSYLATLALKVKTFYVIHLLHNEMLLQKSLFCINMGYSRWNAHLAIVNHDFPIKKMQSGYPSSKKSSVLLNNNLMELSSLRRNPSSESTVLLNKSKKEFKYNRVL